MRPLNASSQMGAAPQNYIQLNTTGNEVTDMVLKQQYREKKTQSISCHLYSVCIYHYYLLFVFPLEPLLEGTE